MAMTGQVDLEHDVLTEAAERAAEQGLSVNAYVSLVLRRAFERVPGEEAVLAYDHVANDDSVVIDREANEDDESYARRTALYRDVFGR